MTQVSEIITRLSSAAVGGTSSTDTWRIVARDFLPGSIGGSTQAQQICVTPTGGFNQEYAEALTYPTFQVRVRAASTSSTGLEAKTQAVVAALNLSGRWYPYGTMYLCTDATTGADSQVRGLNTPATTGAVMIGFYVRKGSATQQNITYYRSIGGLAVIDATITWSGTVPSIAMATGALVSSSLLSGDSAVYKVILSGTVLAATPHWLQVTFANAVASVSTGTVWFGNWTTSNGTSFANVAGDNTAMTSWLLLNSAIAISVDSTLPTYIDILQQGDLLFIGRDELQRPIYSANFMALRSRTT